MARTGRTIYSEKIKGVPSNHNFAVRFDDTDGHLGITQFDGEAVSDRVLLSPDQVRKLLNFVAGKKARAA